VIGGEEGSQESGMSLCDQSMAANLLYAWMMTGGWVCRTKKTKKEEPACRRTLLLSRITFRRRPGVRLVARAFP
jgi:hypothetical protein